MGNGMAPVPPIRLASDNLTDDALLVAPSDFPLCRERVRVVISLEKRFRLADFAAVQLPYRSARPGKFRHIPAPQSDWARYRFALKTHARPRPGAVITQDCSPRLPHYQYDLQS